MTVKYPRKHKEQTRRSSLKLHLKVVAYLHLCDKIPLYVEVFELCLRFSRAQNKTSFNLHAIEKLKKAQGLDAKGIFTEKMPIPTQNTATPSVAALLFH